MKFIYSIQQVESHKKIFFFELNQQLANIGVDHIHIEKMSDNTLNLTYLGMQFGRVKFSRTGHSIQVLTSNTVKWNYHINIMELISKIPYLVDYVYILNARLTREMNLETIRHEDDHIQNNDLHSEETADAIESKRHRV